MRLTFICVGRLSKEYAAVWRHYAGMIKPYASVEVLETPECPPSQGEATVRTKESAAISAVLRPNAFTVALDGRGRQYSSEEWSGFMADKKLHGRSHFQFILGGAGGLDESVLARADEVWSLSAATFPHQMARCIVLEQIYRAVRIERGEPYHH